MATPDVMKGTFDFVWEVDACGGVNGVVSKARGLGVTGVIVKFANGSLANDSVSQKFMSDFKTVAPMLKAAGLRVGGWIYNYLTDVDGEVAACVEAVNAGADFIVLDGEVEVQGKNALVTEFGQKLKAALPNTPIGYSGMAIANYHPQVPYAEYAAFADVLMPQIYWADMGMDVAVAFNLSIESFKKFGKPIAPTGQAYAAATPADMARFVALCKQAGYEHVSWWDMQHHTNAQSKAMFENILPAPKPQPAQKPIANDVAADAWYAPAVAYAIKEGIMVGDGNGNFRPDAPLTRAEAAQIIYTLTHQK